MASTSISAVSRPLKEYYWLYRDRVLHFRRSAAKMDDLYWLYRPSVISSISPTQAAAQAVITLDVFGSFFRASSLIFFNGIQVPTTFINSGHLSSVNLDVGTAGVKPVSVHDNGAVSNELNFTVT
jgi:IPT/TIG domain